MTMRNDNSPIIEMMFIDYARSRKIRSVCIEQGHLLNRPDRWTITVDDGEQSARPLIAQRKNLRSWASLDTLISYLKDCGIRNPRIRIPL